MTTITEVMFQEYNLMTGVHTVYFTETEEEFDIIPCVIELWLEENQKKCVEGMAENVLCGM